MNLHLLRVSAFFTIFAGCAGSDGGAPSGTGGTQTGGALNTGGAANAGTSATATGGTHTGGVPIGATTGGQPIASGGTSGGMAATGGSTGGLPPGTGGVTANGGTATTGGTTATGGAATTGGTTTTGGTATTGGTTTTGGIGGTATTGGAGGASSAQWVGTWTASPYPVDSGNQPPSSLANAVLRQVVRVSLGGSQLRVQFSNLSGNGPVTLKSAHIALCRATPAVDSTIDVATDKALTFGGAASITIEAGKEIWSDTIAFALPALGNLTISTAFGAVPGNLTGHAGSRTTSYLQTGSSDVSAASMTSAQTTDHWYYISGIDVMAEPPAKGIVAIGDSITDGRGTDTNKNNRWTDVLAARLQANAATKHLAVMNQGIGATNLVGTTGTAAQARLNRDALGQSGAKYLVVFDGVNDIGNSASFAAMKAAYDDIIARAHAKGVIVYGATILPFGGNSYYSESHESVRQQVNAYIKSGAFDGYIDFDAALTDGGTPPKLQTSYATWSQMDGLHPGPAGYQKLGQSVDLSLFTK